MTADRQQYFGKFRGRVIDNIDPLSIGRLQVDVPALPFIVGTWALPCVPYAGPHVGFHFIPPLGANVWVEFEGGNPNSPIWVGCFWSEGERPELAIGPDVKMIQTPTATLMMDDTPEAGGISLSIRDPAVEVPASLSMDAAGIRVEVDPAGITMSPEEGVTITYQESDISLTEEGIAANSSGTVSVDAGADISMTRPTEGDR